MNLPGKPWREGLPTFDLLIGIYTKQWDFLLFGGLVAINFIFPYIGNLIIPIDFHIFQRGGPTTNQFVRLPTIRNFFIFYFLGDGSSWHFSLVFPIVLVIVSQTKTWLLLRLAKDVRYLSEVQKVWPESVRAWDVLRSWSDHPKELADPHVWGLGRRDLLDIYQFITIKSP